MKTLIALAGLALMTLSEASRAAEPPPCDDAEILRTIQTQNEMAEMMASSSRKLIAIEAAGEVSLGPPPAAANQYATAETVIALSRYCEGFARLETGDSDPLYWRIDQAQDGVEESARVDHCSKRHDVL